MRRRKRLIPTIILTILCWLGLGYIIYASSPSGSIAFGLPFSIPSLVLFFLLLFFALFLTMSFLLNNSRRGFLIAVGLVVIVFLRLLKFFHPLYIILVIALLVTTEFYFLKK